MAELLSSSDEDSSPPRQRPRPSRPLPTSVAAATVGTGKSDDVVSALLTRGPSSSSKARSSSAAWVSSTRQTTDSGNAANVPPRGLPKQVISARDLLTKLLGKDKAADKLFSPPKSKTTIAAVKTPIRQPDVQDTKTSMTKLSPSEQIALKYGLLPSGRSRATESAGLQQSPKNEPETKPNRSRKQTFWKDQMPDAVQDTSSSYVSPFRSPELFHDMRQRRRKAKSLDAQQRSLDEDLSTDTRRRSVDSARVGSMSGSTDVAGKLSPTAVSPTNRQPSIPSGTGNDDGVDDDFWLSDADAIASDSDEATVFSESHFDPTKVAPRASTEMSASGGMRTSRKRQRDSRDEVKPLASDPAFAEHWPKLPSPTNDEGPLRISFEEYSTELTVCANINNYLYDYQREGTQFLCRAYLGNTGAILGDEMGLGKTIQVIALFAAILKKTGKMEDQQAWRQLRTLRRERHAQCSDVDGGLGSDAFCGGAAPILIVVPASLLHNWEAELHLWMCCCTVILYGKPQQRETILDQIERGEYEVIICSYDILKISIDRLHKIPWEVVILDEMHCLKNPEAQLTKAVKSIKCRKKLGLTGTLMQNNEMELHCLVDTIAPGVLGSWQEFNMYYGVDIKYGRKKSAVPEALKRSRLKEKKLRQKLVPYYLRREKAINPQFQKVKKCDQVVFCDLTPLQMRAYKRILAMPEFDLLRRGEEICDCKRHSRRKRKICCYQTPMSIGVSSDDAVIWSRFHPKGEACRYCPDCMGLVCVAQLLKLANHMELLKVNPHDPVDIQQYHTRFAAGAFGDDIDAVGGVEQVTTFQETRMMGTKTCGKMVVLEKLLALWQKRRQKTLLFSRSTRMLDILQLFLISKAISYSRLDGNTRVDERLQLVNEFNRSGSNKSVFLISTKAGGVGLNLPSATNVVIFDPSWNPAHDCQAQDRAYRIGQTKDVQVYRLITLGTIEEMMYVRQIYKQQLSDTTLKGVKAPRYFEGVQGDPNQKGELFGIRNLLCWKEGGVLKDIQDAYKRDSDGFMLQDNQIEYEQLVKEKKKTRKPPNDEDDGEEMVEVADELMADMLGTPSSAGITASNPPSASDPAGDEQESDEEEFVLPGATTAMHEAIVGKQSRFDDHSSASDNEGEHEFDNVEQVAKKLHFPIEVPKQKPPTSSTTTKQALPSVSHPALRKKHDVGAVVGDTDAEPRRALYVPKYV